MRNSTLLILLLLLGAEAQTSWVDTSILKNGNTWEYRKNDYSSSSSGNYGSTSYLGTTKFTLTGFTLSNGTLKFNVVQVDTGTTETTRPEYYFNDSLQAYLYGVPPPRYSSSSVTIAYTFANNTFSPSTPFFAKGQVFSDTSGRVLYQGDTLFRQATATPPGTAAYATTENIERIGRTYDRYSSRGGLSSAGTDYQLLSFNGQAFTPGNVQVVSILGSGLQVRQKSAQPIIRYDGRRILLQNKERFYDIRGGRIQPPTAR